MYLGTTVNHGGDSEKVMERRLAKAKSVFETKEDLEFKEVQQLHNTCILVKPALLLYVDRKCRRLTLPIITTEWTFLIQYVS